MQIYEKADVLQWFCGFYEGEGWVSNDKGNNNRIRLGIAQNDITPLEIARSIWGGAIRKRVRKSIASDKICTGYEWLLPHTQSLIFIKDITPYMLIPYKKAQVATVLNTFETAAPLRYACTLCANTYANPSARRRHVKATHIHSDASSTHVLQEDQIAGTS